MKASMDLPEEFFETMKNAVVAELLERGVVLAAAERTRPYSGEEAAEELGVSVTQVRRMVVEGYLERVAGTSRLLITVRSLRALQGGKEGA